TLSAFYFGVINKESEARILSIQFQQSLNVFSKNLLFLVSSYVHLLDAWNRRFQIANGKGKVTAHHHSLRAKKLVGELERRLVEADGIRVQIPQVFGGRFLGFNSAHGIVVTPVDPAGKKRYAGAEMGNHKVKLGKPFEYSGISKPCRR